MYSIVHVQKVYKNYWNGLGLYGIILYVFYYYTLVLCRGVCAIYESGFHIKNLETNDASY